MKISKLQILTIITTLFLIAIMLNDLIHRVDKIDQRTIELCKEWAAGDHRKAIGYERYEKMHQYWTGFDWYESCINQH